MNAVDLYIWGQTVWFVLTHPRQCYESMRRVGDCEDCEDGVCDLHRRQLYTFASTGDLPDEDEDPGRPGPDYDDDLSYVQ